MKKVCAIYEGPHLDIILKVHAINSMLTEAITNFKPEITHTCLSRGNTEEDTSHLD